MSLEAMEPCEVVPHLEGMESYEAVLLLGEIEDYEVVAEGSMENSSQSF